MFEFEFDGVRDNAVCLIQQYIQVNVRIMFLGRSDLLYLVSVNHIHHYFDSK